MIKKRAALPGDIRVPLKSGQSGPLGHLSPWAMALVPAIVVALSELSSGLWGGSLNLLCMLSVLCPISLVLTRPLVFLDLLSYTGVFLC